ncbi:MAG: VWA domain-containing protein [Thermoanaerobaculia bacterium]
MKLRPLPLALITALYLFSNPGPGSIAQEAATVFVERVEVNVVNVEVFVTDKRGQSVTGLTAEDFTVTQDGQPVAITNFYTVEDTGRGSLPAAVAEAAPDAVPEAAPAPQTGPADAVVPAEQRLHLLVYIDNFNINPSNREKVLADLEGFLEKRSIGGDQIMLMTYNRSLNVVRPFTDDPREIAAGLDEIRKTTANGMKEQARRQMTARNIAIALRDPMTADSAPIFLQRYVQETRAKLQMSTQAIESVVRSMSGLPGRKAFLYVSDGLPRRPGQRLGEQFFGEDSMSLTADEGPLFSSITHQANAHQVTFYTLDARGSKGGGTTVSAAFSGEVAGGNNRANLDAIESMNLQEPLIDMAETTGGTSFVNTANFDAAMDTMAKDFDTYYSLGFNARTPGDGKYHKIDVRVNRPGLKVRHRSGFLDKPQIERTGDRTLASLIVGMEKNPLGIRLRFAPAEKKGSKRYLLPLLLQIPIAELTLLPNGANQEGRLRIFVVVQGEEGGVSPLQDVPFPVSIPTAEIEQVRQSTIGFTTQLEIRPGHQKIAVGVFDELSGIESFVSETVQVGKVKKRK